MNIHKLLAFILLLSFFSLGAQKKEPSYIAGLRIIIRNMVENNKGSTNFDSWLENHTIVPEDHQSFLILIKDNMQLLPPLFVLDLFSFAYEQKIDINAELPNQKFFLHQAVEYQQLAIIQFLLEKGAQPNNLDNRFRTALDCLDRRRKKSKEIEALLRINGGYTSEEISDQLLRTHQPPTLENIKTSSTDTLLNKKYPPKKRSFPLSFRKK